MENKSQTLVNKDGNDSISIDKIEIHFPKTTSFYCQNRECVFFILCLKFGLNKRVSNLPQKEETESQS